MLMLLGFIGSIWVVLRMLLSASLKPGSAAWDNLVRKLRGHTEEVSASLVTWDKEMLSLLSLNQTRQKKPGMFSGESSGIFTTIYQEPVLAYSSEAMKGAGLALVRTSKDELILRNKGREVEIWINKQPFGVLIEGVLLASGRGSRQLARIEDSAGEAQFPVIIAEKTVAAITNTRKTDSPNPRAVTLLKALNEEEEHIVLALTVAKMLFN